MRGESLTGDMGGRASDAAVKNNLPCAPQNKHTHPHQIESPDMTAFTVLLCYEPSNLFSPASRTREFKIKP